MTHRYFVFLLLVLLRLSAYAAAGQAAPASAAAPEYLPNHGQWPVAAQLRADIAPGLRLFAEADRLVWLRYDAAAWAEWAHHAVGNPRAAPTGHVGAHAWAVEFVGAAPGAVARPEGATVGPVRNFLLGADARRWATGVRATAAARYAALWPGIDLRLHASPRGEFEYDLEVRPGADPGRAVFRYRGLTDVRLDAATGHLHLRTALGELTEAAPIAWQPDGTGGRRAVPVRFVVATEATRGREPTTRVSFELPRGYDRTRPLTIDPVLVFATHSGSTAPVFGHTATYDHFGHLYAAGPCYDPGYPATLGAFDLTHSNDTVSGGYANPDVAISRYAPDGSTLRYATYLGGTAPDYPHSLLVNRRGDLLVLGTTQSADFPTTAAAYDTTFGQGFDVFVARLDSTGARLVGSTYLGAEADDGYTQTGLPFFYGDGFRGDLAVDTLDRVYVATTTVSAGFPFTAGAVRPPAGYREAAVVARFSADLRALDWAAGLGQVASAYSLYLPPSGAPYVVGATHSTGLATTPGTLAPDSTRGTAARQRDGFIAQLSPDGDSIRAATYLRASRTRQPASQTFFVQGIPGSSDVAVLGSSTGPYAISAGRWGQAGGGLVIQRLSADLMQRRWATTLGHPVTTAGTTGVTTDNLSPTAFLVDRCGALYVSAWGNTTGLPTTTNAIQRTTDGQDLYMLVLTPDATALEYATYLGGQSANAFAEEHVDGGTSRFDPQGRIYQSICTNSANFPTTAGAWSTTNQVLNFQYDVVAVKLDFERRLVQAVGTAVDAGGGAPAYLTVPATVQFVNRSTTFAGTTYEWRFGDGSAPSTQTAPQHTYTRAGVFGVTLIARDAGSCAGADTTRFELTVHRPDTTLTGSFAVCRGDSVRLTGALLEPGSFTWSPGATLSDSTALAPLAAPDTTTTYQATGILATGAVPTQRVRWLTTVRVLDSLRAAGAVTALGGGPATGLTAPATVQLVNTTTGGASAGGPRWQWDFGDGSAPDTTRAPRHTYQRGGTYSIRLLATDPESCNGADFIQFVLALNQPDSIAAPQLVSICRGDSVQLAGYALVPGTVSWTPGAGLSDSAAVAPWAAPDSTTTYFATGTEATTGRRLRASVTVAVREHLRAAATATALSGGPASGQTAPATVQLVNATPARPGTHWQWRFGDGSAPDTSRAPQHTYQRAGSYTVWLAALNPTTCTPADSTSLTISVTLADSSAAVALTICPGDSVRLPGAGLVPGTFRWAPEAGLSDPAAPTPWAAPAAATTYQAVGTALAQPRRLTLSVAVGLRTPQPPAFTTDQRCLPGGTTATFRLSGPVPASGTWDFGDGTTAPLTGATATHTYALPPGAQEFAVTLRGLDADGCRIETRQLFRAETLTVPDVITPGALDGRNDALQLPCFEPGTATLRVFNRWGRVVYDSGENAYANDWQAEGLAAGTYFYELRLSFAPGPFKGWVQVVR